MLVEIKVFPENTNQYDLMIKKKLFYTVNEVCQFLLLANN